MERLKKITTQHEENKKTRKITPNIINWIDTWLPFWSLFFQTFKFIQTYVGTHFIPKWGQLVYTVLYILFT